MKAFAFSSSSSSSRNSKTKHHVFLSFRGDDTRENFTSHLYAALCRNKIDTFIDNEDLDRGDEISPSLLKAIEESKIAIIIFSKDYASSRWCLEELVKIIECKSLRDLIVVPIFYNVDPSDVRKQTGTFGKAFVKHEEEQSLEKVLRWRNALTEAANLSGFDSKNIRLEAALIEEIVQNILKILHHIFPKVNKGLVGLESRIKALESLLQLQSTDVFTVGVWGMGGIGKTTLAQAVYNNISSKFDGYYFLNNVREESEKHGFSRLLQELLSALLDDRYATLQSTFTKNRLHNKKVLIVFDDVTCSEQIEKLIGNDHDCFGPGSRMIITTRDKQVLRNFGVNHDKIYEVKALPDKAALKLFSCHAFKQDVPTIGYKNLSLEVVKLVKGVPLALKVLGCLLLNKTKQQWESVVCNLERVSDSKILDVLKISYDGLNDEQKNIFLDIACFFNGDHKNRVMKILNASGFASEIGISILIDMSLITIKIDGEITMHDLLQELGRKIVNKESKDPAKRSRLWHHEDIYRVLIKNTGTEAIEGIKLDMSKIKDVYLKPDAFLKMCNLRILNFYSSNKVHPFEGFEFSSLDLVLFQWPQYPLKSFSSNFYQKNLVELIMPCSNVKQLWNDVQNLDYLTDIDLSHSKHLSKIPDLSLAPNLERLILEDCISLIEVHPSIQYLNKLVFLNLRGCKSLTSLPINIRSRSLRCIILSGCSNLKMAPKIVGNLEYLYLDGTSIQELPLFDHPSRLVHLDLRDCSRLENLSSTIYKLESLRSLSLAGCSKLTRLPNDFGRDFGDLSSLDLENCQIMKIPDSFCQLSSLEDLHLRGNNFVCLPESFQKLRKLRYLDISNCEKLRFILMLPRSWLNVVACNCTSLEEVSLSCFKIKVEKDVMTIQSKISKSKGASVIYPGNEIAELFYSRQMGYSIIALKQRQEPCKIQKSISLSVGSVIKFYDQYNTETRFNYNLIGIDEYHTRQEVSTMVLKEEENREERQSKRLKIMDF